MYTQCSKCETVFKLSAETLRAAGGQVRCGKCGELFNALARLAEESSAFPPGESPLELEARADSILESSDALQVVRAVAKNQEEELVPPGVEGVQLEFVDPDRAMEFTLPPGELDRIFIESKRRALPLPTSPQAPAAPEDEIEVELDLDPGEGLANPNPNPTPNSNLNLNPNPCCSVAPRRCNRIGAVHASPASKSPKTSAAK